MGSATGLLLGVLVLALAACDRDDSKSVPDTPATSTGEVVVEVPARVEELLPGKVRDIAKFECGRELQTNNRHHIEPDAAINRICVVTFQDGKKTQVLQLGPGRKDWVRVPRNVVF
jgi:hypothetical protein